MQDILKFNNANTERIMNQTHVSHYFLYLFQNHYTSFFLPRKSKDFSGNTTLNNCI